MSDDPDPGHRSTAAARNASDASARLIDVLLPEDQWDTGETHAISTRLRLAADAALDTAGAGPGGLTVVLGDDEEIRTLNRQFRGADKPTNVLAFPAEYTPPEPGALRHLGDVIIARETVMREAQAQGKTFMQHAMHLVVHGVLHLIGYTHDTDDEATRMEALEVTALKRLGLPDPYAERTLAET